MGPVRSESTLQLVPNWNAITIPLTTPIANDSAKILSQKSNTRRYTGLPVARCTPSIVASQLASPMVKAGKIMWKLTTNANCSRDRKTGSRSIVILPGTLLFGLQRISVKSAFNTPGAVVGRLLSTPRRDFRSRVASGGL
jgi:hypothetical protein